MARREFSKAVQAQIVLRATNEAGHVVCEGCQLVLGKKPYEIDHTIADALQVDKRGKLTAEDGKLLGKECCHAPKTKVDVAMIAQAKRREAKHLGVSRPSGKLRGQPFPAPQKATSKREPSSKAMPPRSLFCPVGGVMQPGRNVEGD